MTFLNAIESFSTVYEKHIIIGIACFSLAYVFGFIHGHSRNRKS